MEKKDPNSGKLLYNFPALLNRMIEGENLLAKPLGVVEGTAPVKSGKGNKVSPNVQNRLSVVDAEMSRVAQEVNVLGNLRHRIMTMKSDLNKEAAVMAEKEYLCRMFQHYIMNNSDGIFNMLLEQDNKMTAEAASPDLD